MRARAFLHGACSLAAAAMLAACSGAGGALPSPPRGAAMQTAAFTMHWPSRQSLAHLRRPLYISPSTLSLVVEVNDDPSLTVIANNPSTSGGSATTTVNIAAPAGADTFYFTLWDAPNGTGNQLGQAQVTQTIAAGKINTIGATVDGVLAKIGISADANQPFLETAIDPGGSPVYTIVGDVPANFAITPLDADNNVIVGPGVVPTLSLSASDSSVNVTQSASNPNRYTVQVVAAPAASVHPSLVATGTDGNGFTATSQVPLVVSPAFFVGYSNGAAGAMQVLDASGNAVPIAGVFAGLQHPNGVAYDSADRLVFVTDSANGGTIFAFTEDGKSASVAPITFAGADAIAYDPQNAEIYVTSQSQNAVGVFTTQGAPVIGPGFSGLNAPAGITLAGSNLCIASASAGTKPACFTNTGAASTPTLYQNSTIASSAIAYDPQQKLLWVTGNASSGPSLTGYDATNGFSLHSYTTGFTAPSAVAFNPILDEVAVLDTASASILEFQDASPYAQDTASAVHVSGSAGTATAFALTY